MFALKSFVLISVLIYNVNCKDFIPSYITPCNIKDAKVEECIKKQIEISLPKFTKGIPELGVPSLDPVELNDISIDGNGLKLLFTKAQMHGLSNSKLSELKVEIGKSDETFRLAFKCDFNLTAQYEVDGRILILPIQGKGDAFVDAQGVEVVIDSKLVHVKDDKGEHLKLITPSYKYTVKKTVFDLKNLFNGNKQLADATLQFANENWQQLMDELAPPAIKQIVKTCVKSINKFFSNVTIQQIILGYEQKD